MHEKAHNAGKYRTKNMDSVQCAQSQPMHVPKYYNTSTEFMMHVDIMQCLSPTCNSSMRNAMIT